MQMQLPYVLFTPLADYQSMGDAAAPFFTLVYYTELLQSKEVVLCRGDILARGGTGESLTAGEGQRLMNLAHEYYVDPEKYAMVETMNHQPEIFSFDELVQDVMKPAH